MKGVRCLADKRESGRKSRSLDDVTSHHRRFRRNWHPRTALLPVEGRLIERASLLGGDPEAFLGVLDGGGDALARQAAKLRDGRPSTQPGTVTESRSSRGMTLRSRRGWGRRWTRPGRKR